MYNGREVPPAEGGIVPLMRGGRAKNRSSGDDSHAVAGGFIDVGRPGNGAAA